MRHVLRYRALWRLINSFEEQLRAELAVLATTTTLRDIWPLSARNLAPELPQNTPDPRITTRAMWVNDNLTPIAQSGRSDTS